MMSSPRGPLDLRGKAEIPSLKDTLTGKGKRRRPNLSMQKLSNLTDLSLGILGSRCLTRIESSTSPEKCT